MRNDSTERIWQERECHMSLLTINTTKRGAIFCIIQLLLLFPAIGLMLLGLKLPNFFLGGASAVIDVLQAYGRWYLLLIVLAVIAIAIVLIGNLVMLISLADTRKLGGANVVMLLLSLGLVGLCTVVMILDEGVVGLRAAVYEDIAAVESGDTVTILTFAHENTLPFATVRMPGPYADGQPEPFTALRVRNPAGAWMTLNIPDEIDLDVIGQDGYFEERIGAVSHHPDLQFIRVSYTPNFQIVVELEAAPRPEDEQAVMESYRS